MQPSDRKYWLSIRTSVWLMSKPSVHFGQNLLFPLTTVADDASFSSTGFRADSTYCPLMVSTSFCWVTSTVLNIIYGQLFRYKLLWWKTLPTWTYFLSDVTCGWSRHSVLWLLLFYYKMLVKTLKITWIATFSSARKLIISEMNVTIRSPSRAPVVPSVPKNSTKRMWICSISNN